MTCKNKSCKKGVMGKRAKFEPINNALFCSQDCLLEWVKTEQGKRELAQKVKKEKQSEKKLFKASDAMKKAKNPLQDEINKLSRKIDAKFEFKTCICCDRPLLKEVQGAHLLSVGSSNSTRYNLHMIHSATLYCNTYKKNHEEDYKIGLQKRYGAEYLERVLHLKADYPYIKLSEVEYLEKLAIVRKINREFDTYKLTNPIFARDMFNELIGIYL